MPRQQEPHEHVSQDEPGTDTSAVSSELSWLVPLLICPVCADSLTHIPDPLDPDQGSLRHQRGGCSETYPIIDGVPRLLVGHHRARLVEAKRPWFAASDDRSALAAQWRDSAGTEVHDPVIRGFDYEWSKFRQVATDELVDIFGLYFGLVPADAFRQEAIVLDAGCGGGRWAYEVARRGPRVVALDLGLSVEIARANTRQLGRVSCVQADVRRLPLRPKSVDWAYSLGVLHHIADPAAALSRITAAVRPRGAVLLYLYYALDNRGPAYRALFRLADVARRVISPMPRPVVAVIAFAIALGAYFPLARVAALLQHAGLVRLARSLPLAFYRSRSFRVMRNDSLDRFGTRLERRYSKDAMVALMRSSGLEDVLVSSEPPFWHAVGRRP